MNTLRPLNDRVLVRQDPAEDKIGSIFVPQGSEHYPCYGTVIATGPGALLPNGKRAEPLVKVGDRVLFQRQPSSALLPDNREYDERGFKDLLMLKQENILAVIDPD